MPYIKLAFREAERANQVLEEAVRELEGVASELADIRASLDPNLLGRWQNGERLSAELQEAKRLARRAKALARTAEDGLEQYRKTENKLRGGAARL